MKVADSNDLLSKDGCMAGIATKMNASLATLFDVDPLEVTARPISMEEIFRAEIFQNPSGTDSVGPFIDFLQDQGKPEEVAHQVVSSAIDHALLFDIVREPTSSVHKVKYAAWLEEKGFPGHAQLFRKTPSLHPLQVEFIQRYDVKVLGESKIQLTLKAGTRRIKLVEDVVKLAEEYPIILTNGATRIAAVYENRLNEWRDSGAFTSIEDEDRKIAAEMFVPDSVNMTRAQQKNTHPSWNNLDMADLAVTALAYLAATGNNPFKDTAEFHQGHVVRAHTGALYLEEYGLDTRDLYSEFSSADISASMSIPYQNFKP